MDERKLRILHAIIDDYIMTAVPVASRTISRKYDVGGLSSATIRNEMSDLEILGYLAQPHTSAGRVPSAKAYRLYVERLLRALPVLMPSEAHALREHLTYRVQQVQEILHEAAVAVADTTHYTTVVLGPQAHPFRVKHVQLVPVAEDSALLILVTDVGVFKDTLLRLGSGLNADHLHSISKMLTAHMAGHTLDEVRGSLSKLTRTLRDHAGLMADVLNALEKVQAEAVESPQIAIGGSANILHYPEYSDAEKARAFLSVLEAQDKLRILLLNSQPMDFTLRIGSETGMPEMEDCAVVTATYSVGGAMGTIGVIGPIRMRYAHVLSVLGTMGQSLSELLRGE